MYTQNYFIPWSTIYNPYTSVLIKILLIFNPIQQIHIKVNIIIVSLFDTINIFCPLCITI